MADGENGVSGDKLDALLTEWESLQNDIRELKNQYHRRIIRGAIVLAAVAGYAVQAQATWLLVFIPIIIGLIFTIHVQEANSVYYRSWQCYRIEAELDIERFDWTERFAGLTRPNTLVSDGRTRYDLSWRLSPSGTAYGLGAVVYGGFAIYSALVVVPDQIPENYQVFLGVPSWVWDSGFYALLTLVLFVIGYTHWSIRMEFKNEERNGRTVQ